MADGQPSGPPQEFERRLGRVPVPPPRGILGLAASDIERGGRPVLGHVFQDRVELVMPARSLPGGPAPAHARLVPFELEPPHRVEGHRDHRRIVRPVFEGGPPLGHESLQRPGAVLAAPCPENQIVGPRERVDAVDLNEAEPVKQAFQIGPCARTGVRSQEVVPVEEETARIAVAEERAGHADCKVHWDDRSAISQGASPAPVFQAGMKLSRYRSRSSFFCTLPIVLRGSSSMRTYPRGCL